MNWLQNLLSSDEAAADSVVFSTIIAVLTAAGIAITLVVKDRPFSLTDFGTCMAAIIGAGGGVKVFRERFSVNRS